MEFPSPEVINRCVEVALTDISKALVLGQQSDLTTLKAKLDDSINQI